MSLAVRYLDLSRLFVAVCLLLAAAGTGAVEIEKSPNDPRQYRYVELENRLRVLLISDPETDESAAALDVNIGSGSDPSTRPGLAHFLEHMLFLGTDRYPDARSYQEFIRANGGNHNASTSYSRTNYYFSVTPDKLEPALDRFSRFFIAPLFNPENVASEREIIESEYRSRKESEGRRILSARDQLLNPAHPMARFAVGSVKTLDDRSGSTVREELISFYRRHYSANVMTLVVLGREPLDQLQEMVSSRFSEIEDRNALAQDFRVPLYLASELPALVAIVPREEQRLLSMTFPMPSTWNEFDTQPLGYLGGVLGHEGEGSLLSWLKEKGWAESLSAGPAVELPSQSTFEISMRLTPLGVSQWTDVVEAVFAHVRLLGENGVQEWIFNEQKQLAEIAFRFLEQRNPLGYVQSLAGRMHRWPAALVLSGPYRYKHFKPKLIDEYLEYIEPSNMALTLVDHGLETNARTEWFDTEYRIERLDGRLVERFAAAEPDPRQRIQSPNPFIPDELALVADGTGDGRPALVEDTGEVQTWLQTDIRFGAPKANTFLTVRSPLAHDSVESAVLTELYAEAVNDALTEYSYPASLADLNYRMYAHSRGFSVRISGFNDRQQEMLDQITSTARKLEVSEVDFVRYRRNLAQQWKNSRKDKPFQQASAELVHLLIEPHWSDEQLLGALDHVTLSDLNQHVGAIFAEANAMLLVHGNVTIDDARELAATVATNLLRDTRPVDVMRSQVVRLNGGGRYQRHYAIEGDDAAAIVYYQGGSKTITSRAMFRLAAQIIEADYYHSLRTEKQLGYVVFATPFELLEVPALAFTLESASASADVLVEEMTRFAAGMAEVFDEMSDADFENHKTSLIKVLTQRPENLNELSRDYWAELDRENFNFDTNALLARAVSAITRSEMAAFLAEFGGDQATLPRLVVQTSGSVTDGTGGTAWGERILDVGRYRDEHARFQP